MKNKEDPSYPQKYFLQAYHQNRFRHGGIGNADIEKILTALGYSAVSFPEGDGGLITIRRYFAMLAKLRKMPAGSILVCQFPVYPRMYRLMMKKLAARNIQLLIIIADIDGLKDGNDKLLFREINLLNLGRYFVVHSPIMNVWVKTFVNGAKTSLLGPFDFLTPPVNKERLKSFTCCFAGNLGKSGFLHSLDQLPEIFFNLYGDGLTEPAKTQFNVSWKGSYEPYELPARLEGSFGLVWDGDSMQGSEGSLGDYMQYIFHHKISLYILAGIPIIAPAFAGSAQYIVQNGIGWVLKNLEEMPELIARISEEEYQSAKENMKPIALDISQGMHLKKALAELESEMKNPV